MSGSVLMTEEQMQEIARGNIERHLGDCEELQDGEPTADAIYDSAYVLAFDALADAGVAPATARDVAASVAQGFAQP